MAADPVAGPAVRVPVCLQAFAATCVTVLFVAGLDHTDLWASHEARAAQDAQRILDDGDWGLPRLFDDQPELQKPPGFYWLAALTARAVRGGHVDAWAVRLPAALSALLTLTVMVALARRAGRPVAGFAAALALATAVHYTGMARTARIDMPLTAAVTAAMFLGSEPAITGHAIGRGRVLVLGVVLAGALLLKGLVGLVLPVAALVTAYALRPRPHLGSIPSPWAGLCLATGLAILLAAPWFLWATAETGGEFFRVFFIYHHFNRAFGGADALAGHPWWYYVPRLAVDFLPSTVPLAVALIANLRSRGTSADNLARFGGVWLAVMVGVLSCSRFKRADYLLPAYPGAALLVGCFAERWLGTLSAGGRRLAAGGAAALLVCALLGWWAFDAFLLPRQGAPREQRRFAAAVREYAPVPQTVLLFRVESHLLAYHLGRPLHTLVEWGELNDLLARPATHHFVTRAEFVSECVRNVHTRRLELVARSEDFSDAAPLRPLVLMRTAPQFPANVAVTGPGLCACPTKPSRD